MHRSRVSGARFVFIALVAVLLGGQQDCMEDAPPVYSRNPLALDCVLFAGNFPGN
jgi:hypothetical protein